MKSSWTNLQSLFRGVKSKFLSFYRIWASQVQHWAAASFLDIDLIVRKIALLISGF